MKEKEIERQTYTVKQAALALQTSTDNVYKLIKLGYIQGLKLGSLKIPKFEVSRFLVDNLGRDFDDILKPKEEMAV
ncbi:helix-turn-helix domain-containing protein [Carnobacterium gallinarum]|uniref:helix-turn-helix domain-containing protein n=1 Tax=Carnobacterium gallinarum TaxID=2749 RepID=UPI00054D9D3E|nr:helix-turn-helix domain-containing protein [Carnobacterium gallinarum]